MSEKRLLLVEDSADDEALILRALKRHGVSVDVTITHDGVEAFDYLYGQQAGGDRPPHLILLDLKMPRIDGFQVIKRVRSEERTRDVPVVVFSSSNEAGDVQRSYELGASSFVRKPVEFEEFSEAVRLLGRYWLGLNLTRTRGRLERTRAQATA